MNKETLLDKIRGRRNQRDSVSLISGYFGHQRKAECSEADILASAAAVETWLTATSWQKRPEEMWLGDLKRAVEDVILRPEENPMHMLEKRGTIAALDLCQLDPTPSVPAGAPSAAAMNTYSCSSETVPEMPRQSAQLCTSTSLDTIVNRPQPYLQRHSAGVSRRQSRVLSNLQSKRKRSNSLTNYNKRPGMSVSLPPSARQTPLRFGEDPLYRSSLGSSESHSSVARSEDFSQDYVAEEDEISSSQLILDTSISPAPIPACPAPSPNPFMAYRSRPEEEDMDCD